MPTYQYACTSCGEQLEVMQRFSDDPLTVCPACGGTLRKVFSPVGIVFKGSGFYRTDSRNATIPSGDKPGDKSSEKSGDKDKVTAKANGSGDGSSSAAKSSSGSGSSSSDSSGSAGKKPAKTASGGSGS